MDHCSSRNSPFVIETWVMPFGSILGILYFHAGTILNNPRFIGRGETALVTAPLSIRPDRWPNRRCKMSSTTDKIKGVANEAAGNVKQAVGKAVGNDRLRAEGIAQEAKGDAQQAVGKAKDAVKKLVDNA
jgi:uncharacterized protein YjbJ (UPF0337 family)